MSRIVLCLLGSFLLSSTFSFAQIVNPGYEDGNSGWSVSTTAFVYNPDAPVRSGSGNLGLFSTSYYDFKITQALTDIPPGVYDLEVHIRRGSSEGTLVLCATNSDSTDYSADLASLPTNTGDYHLARLPSILVTAPGNLDISLRGQGCIFDYKIDDWNLRSDSTVFDLSDTNQTVFGCSAVAWAGDTTIETMFSELGFEFLMLKFNGLFELPAPYINGTTVEDFDPYWQTNGHWTAMRNSMNMAQRLGIDVYFYTWEVPNAWMDANKFLLPQHFDRFAKMWASIVKTYSQAGMPPDYIAVFGELNGVWSPGVSPAEYNTLVKMIRQELDGQGYSHVGISGPISVPIEAYRPERPVDWISALDPQGVAAHAFLAMQGHEFDWDAINAETGHAHIRRCWPSWESAFNTVDPDRDVPILINNYNSYTTVFHGVTYPGIESGEPRVVSDTVPWAIRVSEYALSFFNLGAVGSSLWEAADQTFGTGYGILRKVSLGRTRRPIYYAFKSFLPWIPRGSVVVNPPYQPDLDIYAACFINEASSNIVVCMVNGTAKEQSKKIVLSNVEDSASDLTVFKSHSFAQTDDVYTGAIIDKDIELTKEGPGTYSFIAILPSDSLLTVVCNFTEPLVSPSWTLH